MKLILNRKKRQSGFSFTEVLIGVAILLIGFVPVYMLIATSEKSTVETIRTVEGLLEIETILEEIAHLPYDEIPADLGLVPVEEFKSNLKTEYGLKLSVKLRDYLKGFDRKVEVIESGDGKLIKLYYRDARKKKAKSGVQRDLILGTVIFR